VKLYARTPAGTGLGLDVLLTGQVRATGSEEKAGWVIRSVEITLPIGCDSIIGYGVESLPKSPSGRQLLWVDPGDVCADDGSTVNQEALRAEVNRVNEERRADMLRGPLGENWP
jgi:hypothetical protein